MFLTTEDYKVVCGEDALIVINQADINNLQRAERHAVGEISSYLLNRYDMATAYTKTGDDRNEFLISLTCDVALYHLIAAMPKRMGYDIRKERYDRVIEWLNLAQKGNVSIELPLKTDSSGNETGTGIKSGSLSQSVYDW
jgi:phage gp36-like protein